MTLACPLFLLTLLALAIVAIPITAVMASEPLPY
jgi:hypothetical protein